MKTRKLAEVGLALIAVYYVGASAVTAVGLVASGVSSLSVIRGSPASAAVVVVGSLLTAAIPLFFAWLVMGYRKRMAARLAPEDEAVEPDTEMRAPSWEEPAYGLVFVGVGVLMLGWAVSGAAVLLYYLLFYPLLPGVEMVEDGLTFFWRQAGGRQVVTFGLQLFWGLFLVLHAPRLARWCAARAEGRAPASS